MKREYKFDGNALAAFMKENFLAESSIIDDLGDSYLVKNGNGMRPVSKNHIESWALDNGYVKGMGVDALSDHDKMIYEANKARNNMTVQEQEAKQAAVKDENLKAYYDQLPETRLRNAKHEEASIPDGPVRGVHYDIGKK